MPYSFRNVMMQHQREILEGSLKPDESGESAHSYDVKTGSGFIKDRIQQLTLEIPKKIYNHVHFKEVARDFGRLSHYMSDLNDPLLLENRDPREPEYNRDFAQYLEKNIEKFPWIFNSHEHPKLKKGELAGFIQDVAARTIQPYDRIGEAYFPDGKLISSNTFDYRSHPFGIASLSYSRSIENTIQIWYYTWKKSNGDVTYTPFFNKKKRP